MRTVIEMTFATDEKIVYELYDEIVPEAAVILGNAIRNRLLDNMKVERIVPGFVFQPWYDETKRDDRYNIEIRNEPTGIPFKRGSIGLAGDGKKIAVPACFFISLSENDRLTKNFMNIGEVKEGFDVLTKIENLELIKVETNEKVEIYEPKEDLIISTVRITENC